MKTIRFSLVSLLVISCFLIQCTHQEKLNDKIREPAAEKKVNGLQRFAFERCTSDSRMYLEDAILRMPEEYYRSHADEWTKKIPMSCILFAQEEFRGGHAACDHSEGKPSTNAPRPCRTENYVTLTYNAFHDVMDCFNLDPKEFYLQLFIESGFHVDAINKTGFDSGIAQFTANGIKKVTANNLVERTREVLFSSSRPSCNRISSIVGSFDIENFSVKNRCSMISLPQNPYRAMLFNYLHTMLDEIAIERLISQTQDLQPLANEKIKRHLIYLAYNRGVKGTSDLIDGYIANRKKMGHTLTSEDFELDKNLAREKAILNLEPSKRLKLKERKIRNLTFAEYALINGATYVLDMKAANDYIRSRLGDQCGGL